MDYLWVSTWALEKTRGWTKWQAFSLITQSSCYILRKRCGLFWLANICIWGRMRNDFTDTPTAYWNSKNTLDLQPEGYLLLPVTPCLTTWFAFVKKYFKKQVKNKEKLYSHPSWGQHHKHIHTLHMLSRPQHWSERKIFANMEAEGIYPRPLILGWVHIKKSSFPLCSFKRRCITHNYEMITKAQLQSSSNRYFIFTGNKT